MGILYFLRQYRVLWRQWFPLLMATAMGGGCGRRDMGPVTGQVMFSGRPVPDAVVSFLPENRPMAAGKTDSEGRFVLHTYRNGDGAFMGTCKVTVAPFAVGVDDPPDSEPSHNKLSNDRSDIPGIYQSPATSPLSAGVVAGQRNHFEFELAR